MSRWQLITNYGRTWLRVKISSNNKRKWLIRLLKLLHNTLFEKSNFCPKIQFWQNPNIFSSFSPNFLLTFFLVKSKLSTAKKSKTTTFSREKKKKNRQFSQEIKVEFLDKNWRFRTVCSFSSQFLTWILSFSVITLRTFRSHTFTILYWSSLCQKPHKIHTKVFVGLESLNS